MAVHRSARGGGHRRLESHCLGGAPHQLAKSLCWNQTTTGDQHGSQPTGVHQLVERASAETGYGRSVVDPVR